ncbi:MAG: hypothetical protein P4L42_17500 [Desulfocapsaceae bacterium]|nr:hypothetical protein [Desulfocapsaceae bacterium]
MRAKLLIILGLIALFGVITFLRPGSGGRDHENMTANLLPPDKRTEAPGLALRDLSGHLVNLSDYQGRVVLLGFWTTG